jgi:preprotein translocase subunit YajC
MRLNNIQDGEYVITAYGTINNIDTNITINTTIKSGETKKIKF